MLAGLIKKVLGETLCARIREWRHEQGFKRKAKECFLYDFKRFIRFSGGCSDSFDAERAEIILTYHILEKGLTMPNRREGFGKSALAYLMQRVTRFVDQYGLDDGQVRHAIGVVRAYQDIHPNMKDEAMGAFLNRYSGVISAVEPHFTRAGFYAVKNAAFPEFARSRHTVRHYADKEIPLDRVMRAVEIARTTPTACNRQYCRAYCLCDKDKMAEVLKIQGGGRGFSHLADKLILVTVNLEGVNAARERNDVFTNGGMFLMNLCYALHYEEIAHCILNWSRDPEDDIKVRGILPIRESENIVAVICCGEAPDEFDVACSPRVETDELLKVIS